MKRTTILADDQLLLEARHLAAQRRTTFSALVQEALREYLAAHRPKRQLSLIGIGRSAGPPLDLRDGKDEELLAAAIHPIYGWSHDHDSEADPKAPADADAGINGHSR